MVCSRVQPGQGIEAGRGVGRWAGSVDEQWDQPEINILASRANWAWPQALRELFRPRGVNLLVAEQPGQFVNIIRNKRIHTTILDADANEPNALATLRVIRLNYPLMPCILLSGGAGESLLGQALRLEVFSVIGKPVDMNILRGQLDRLFAKRYGSSIFAS